ncbi:MAG TPA: HAD-IIA family hydrolase [Actinocrinis sp.]|nr:HAD-IIA family hydrolase [Actinocrinis sp.]
MTNLESAAADGATTAEPERRAADKPLAALYDTALLDLDGVVYRGKDAVPHAVDSLVAAADAGMRLAYVTNNASRTPKAVASHLRELGLPAHEEDVVTAAQAVARVIAEQVPEGARVLVIGGEGLRQALLEHRLTIVSSAEDNPEAVVQGYRPDTSWTDLAEAAYAIERGAPWFAANTDRTMPTARGIAPGNGALVGAVAAATGTWPTVAGKPEPALHRETMIRTKAQRPLVVGDRLDTDIEGANRAGVDSLLVLTGVTRLEDLKDAPKEHQPTYLAQDLRGLLDPSLLMEWR